MSLPTITIVGNVVTDPQLAFTPQGIARCSFRIAANERKKDENGTWVDGDSTFISVTVWRNVAENVADSITKGSSVVVIGKLRSRTVEDDERGKATYYDVDAETVAIDLRRGSVKQSSTYAPSTSEKKDPWATSSDSDAWGTAIRPLGSSEAPF